MRIAFLPLSFLYAFAYSASMYKYSSLHLETFQTVDLTHRQAFLGFIDTLLTIEDFLKFISQWNIEPKITKKLIGMQITCLVLIER